MNQSQAGYTPLRLFGTESIEPRSEIRLAIDPNSPNSFYVSRILQSFYESLREEWGDKRLWTNSDPSLRARRF